MRDHLKLGMMSLVDMVFKTSVACVALRAVTRAEEEGAWVWTTMLEAAVHFTPTTWTCECLGWLWRDLLSLVTRLTKEGQLLASMCPFTWITACGRIFFLFGGLGFAVFVAGVAGGGGLGVSRTGIFHVLFALFFLTLTIFICPDLILSTSPHSFQTISPIHSVHR